MFIGLDLSLPGLAVGGGGRLAWARDASHAWDFLTDQARFANVYKGPLANTPNWSYTRSQTPTAYAQNAAGVLIPFASGTLRRTDKGVLIEGARTNICLQSQDFSTTWSRVNISAFGSGSVVNATTAPDGTTTADFICPDTSSTQHRLDQAITYGAATMCFSVFLKAAGYGFASIRVGSAGVGINLSTGATNNLTGGWTAFVTQFADGWWRLGLAGSAAANDPVRINVESVSGISGIFAGDGVSGIYAWGAQLEAASFPSSYIPTGAASATRAADVLQVTGLTGVDYPLTLFAEFERAVDTGGNEYAFGLDNNSTTDRAMIYVGTTDLPSYIISTGSVSQASLTLGAALAIGSTVKVAGRVGANSGQAARGGSLGTEDTSVTLPATPTHIRFGTRNGGSEPMFGYLRRAAIWNYALTDAQLQAVTT